MSAAAALRPAAGVAALWWLSTGLIVATQRDGSTLAAAAAGSTLLAVLGGWLLRRSRHDRTPAGVRAAAAGGFLLWLWVATAFYGGWVVGPPTPAPAPATGWAALALQALRSIAYHQVAGLAALALAFALTRGGGNRVGFRVLAAFWAAHELAMLNVFVGVANPSVRFLPEWLRFLERYFGPPQNTPLLAVSVVALTVAAGWSLHRGLRSGDAYGRDAGGVLAALLGLAALEHALLALTWSPPLWELFLRIRG